MRDELTAVDEMGVVIATPAAGRLAVVADDIPVHTLTAVTPELRGCALPVICRGRWQRPRQGPHTNHTQITHHPPTDRTLSTHHTPTTHIHTAHHPHTDHTPSTHPYTDHTQTRTQTRTHTDKGTER